GLHAPAARLRAVGCRHRLPLPRRALVPARPWAAALPPHAGRGALGRALGATAAPHRLCPRLASGARRLLARLYPLPDTAPAGALCARRRRARPARYPPPGCRAAGGAERAPPRRSARPSTPQLRPLRP